MNLLTIIHKYRIFSDLMRGALYRVLMPNIIGKKVKIGINVRMSHNIRLSDYVSISDNVELKCAKYLEISIGYNSSINRNCVILGKVVVGENTAIAPGCMIVGVNHGISDANVLIYKQPSIVKGIVIGDNVWIGANVAVLDGVHIGSSSVIGAGSVVTKSIPPYSVAVGNPCVVIKNRLYN